MCIGCIGPTRAGLSECSFLAADASDLKFKMRLSISAANYLCKIWKCARGIAAVCSPLAWLQPKWVVKAPAQDQRRTADKEELPEQNPQHEVVRILCSRMIVAPLW